MTAEIAVLNKAAVALAADSAVTIGRGPNTKVYNTVNKIFELSETEPVGIMIYGRLDYMGLPFETIIKHYRRTAAGTSFQHLKGYRDHFIEYLSKDVPVDDDAKSANAALIIHDFFTKANTELDNKIYAEMTRTGKFYKSKINGYAKSIISKEITDLKKKPLSAGVSKIQIPAGFEPTVNTLIDNVFNSNPPTEATKKLLRSYAAYLLSKQALSSFRTGLVFAGFGTNELCPSLEAIEIDGIINNRLKYIETKSIDIGRKGPVADILGFAQDDMVHTFLDGVDPAFRKYVKGLIAEIIDDTSQALLGAATADAAEAAKIKTSVQPVFDKMKEDFVKKADAYIEKSFTSRIKDMIRSMPKQEMSLLASQ